MKEILEILANTPVVLIVFVVLAYFLKVFIEKRLEGLASRVEEIGKTSLDLKKGLREQERDELVIFRVAVEKWEYFLLGFLTDFTMLPPSKADISTFYKKDKKLFLDVKVAIVKASIYLRNKDLELQLMAATNKIRETYYPIINQAMPKLIDLQARLMPIENKLKQFEQSGMQDMSFAPTPKDREDNLKLQTLMTDEINKFSENLLKEYKSIAEQMYDLKEAINQYIYRSINRTEIDKD